MFSSTASFFNASSSAGAMNQRDPNDALSYFLTALGMVGGVALIGFFFYCLDKRKTKTQGQETLLEPHSPPSPVSP
jgi:hypothetical protein